MQLNHLNDEQYLAGYVDSLNFIYSNSNIGIVLVKDKDFRYRIVINGLKLSNEGITTNDILGKTDYELKELQKYIGLSDAIRRQDMKVRDSRSCCFFLHVTSAKNPFIVRKHPIINPHTGNFVGIHVYMGNFLWTHPLEAIYKLNDIGIKAINDSNPTHSRLSYKLTERQQMVLFLYIHKYSYSEIASIMTTLGFKISMGRVNDHLQKLKYLFAVKSKEELIENAINQNYHLHIPRAFLKIGTCEINDEIAIS